MALFGLLDTRELEEFATTLAEDLGRRFPPAGESRTDPGAKNQLNIIVEGLAARAVRFHSQHKLGIYRKAKLANTFRWKLSEMGYSKPFVERVTKSVVTRLALK
ncbi:MAG: hypothetical protein IT516_08000 [Burkholderiales bacterium]|nr:hypothetical protein [Burkholderiales bacterium]